MDNNIEVVATATGILADKTLSVGLINGFLELDLLIPELATNVNVGGLGSHSKTDDEGSLYELVRIVSQDFSVLARSWLRLIRVDHQVRWSAKCVIKIVKLMAEGRL